MPTIDARIILILILVELPILLALIWVLRKLRAQAPDDQVLFAAGIWPFRQAAVTES